jgi:hypothetical protein
MLEVKSSKEHYFVQQWSWVDCFIRSNKGDYVCAAIIGEYAHQSWLPITVRVDIIGAIWISQNANTSSRTKHVDIRIKYVIEYCEDGVLKIIFVKCADNDSDTMTKN